MPNEHPKKPRQFSDVAWPGRTPASATSKPVLASNRPSHVDQTVTTQPSQQLVAPKVKPNSIVLDTFSVNDAPIVATHTAKTATRTEVASSAPRNPITNTTTTTDVPMVVLENTIHEQRQKPKISHSSLRRKVIIAVLCAAIIVATVYNIFLLQEYLSLK